MDTRFKFPTEGLFCLVLPSKKNMGLLKLWGAKSLLKGCQFSILAVFNWIQLAPILEGAGSDFNSSEMSDASKTLLLGRFHFLPKKRFNTFYKGA